MPQSISFLLADPKSKRGGAHLGKLKCLLKTHKITKTGMLCILTSEQVLYMSFTGQNHFFDDLTSFPVSTGKKKVQKRNKIYKHSKRGLPEFRCYS